MGIMPTETELTLEQTQQVTMEILLEPTSNKLLVGDVGDSIWIELVTLDINLGPEWKLSNVFYEKPLDPCTPRCIQNYRQAKVLDIKFLCSRDIKTTIQIHDYKLTKGTVKNSQDNKVPRHVPEVYMHQFWDSVYKHDTFYRLKIDKRRRFKLNLEVFRYIFKICPRVQGQDFDVLLTDEEIISFLRDLVSEFFAEFDALKKEVLLIKRCKDDEFDELTKRFSKLETSETFSDAGVSIEEKPKFSFHHNDSSNHIGGVFSEAKASSSSAHPGNDEDVSHLADNMENKTHTSGFSTATKPTPSAAIIKPSVTNEGSGVKPGVPDMTEEESSESEAESWGNDEDDSNNDQDFRSEGSDQEKDSDDDKTQSDSENESDSEHETNESGSESDHEEDEEKIEDYEEEEEEEIVKTPSNDSNDEDETKIAEKAEGDEDEEMDYTTSQLYDDVDIRLNEPVDSDKGVVQEEGTNAAITNVQQGNDNPEILQVIEDAQVTLSTIP
ncbi:hypothetical protein Tco_0965313 [Tanacetum coccineum]